MSDQDRALAGALWQGRELLDSLFRDVRTYRAERLHEAADLLDELARLLWLKAGPVVESDHDQRYADRNRLVIRGKDMELNCGVWANVSSPEDVTWVPLRGAVELHVGPVDLTLTNDTLEAFIAAALQAQKSMRDRDTT